MRGHRSGDLTTRRIEDAPLSFKRLRHDFIGGDHEVFDQIVGTGLPRRFHAGNVSVAHRRDGLHTIEAERAEPVPLRSQRSRRFILQFQLRL